MLFSGYLKVVEFLDRKRVSLKIPNKEIRNIGISFYGKECEIVWN